MAKCYKEQDEGWKRIAETKQKIPSEVWEVFDQLFTEKVKETQKIFREKNYKINRVDGAIILGLIQMMATVISSIKVADKNELTNFGEITVVYDIHHLAVHCLRNDINSLASWAELIVDFNEQNNNEEKIEFIYKEIFDFIDRLKSLTKI
jgi:hypothetical protein